jgi:D-alanine transaminase
MQYDDWVALLETLIQKNAAQGNYLRIHLQVTRGITPLPRTPHFPPNPEPTIFAYARAMRYASIETLSRGFSAITAEDTRWQHCCIKAISLLPNVLHLQAAKAAGATDVILIRDGLITECACSNVFMVKDGVIFTPPLSQDILGGVTRDYVIELATTTMRLNLQEQPITPAALAQADEIWITSSSKPIYPIIQLDGKKIGQGQAGSLWRQVITQYMKEQQIPTHS